VLTNIHVSHDIVATNLRRGGRLSALFRGFFPECSSENIIVIGSCMTRIALIFYFNSLNV